MPSVIKLKQGFYIHYFQYLFWFGVYMSLAYSLYVRL